jgi:hypothetical protein
LARKTSRNIIQGVNEEQRKDTTRSNITSVTFALETEERLKESSTKQVE